MKFIRLVSVCFLGNSVPVHARLDGDADTTIHQQSGGGPAACPSVSTREGGAHIHVHVPMVWVMYGMCTTILELKCVRVLIF
jgi:hypothetical protein